MHTNLWRNWRSILLYGLFLLFSLQLVSEFIESIYSFGLLGTEIPLEMASVLLLFAPALLLIPRRGMSSFGLTALGVGFLACRLVEYWLDTRGRMLVSGVGLAFFLILVPAWLASQSGQSKKELPHQLVLAGTWAVLAQVSLRVVYSGLDISLDRSWGWLSALLVVGAGLLWVIPGRATGAPHTTAVRQAGQTASPEPSSAAGWRVNMWVIGIVAAWALIYFAFGTLNVVARWTGASYPWSVIGVAGMLATFGIILAAFPQRFLWLLHLKPAILWIWNLAFIFCLVMTIWAHQIDFPARPDGYPLFEPAVPGWANLTFVGMLLLMPVILVDFYGYLSQLIDRRVPQRRMAGGFSLAGGFLLVVIFAHIFTTVYDYIPVVGPLFRDRFWLVYLLVGLGLTAPLIATQRSQTTNITLPASTLGEKLSGWIGFGLPAMIAIVGLWLTMARPEPVPADVNSLTVLTYNLQQGYSKAGLKNYRGQLEVLQRENPDLIGLQETDTNRISGGNSDIVRFFADRLNYYSYYSPTTVVGTFGLALLSRYPIQNPRTFFMYSRGEQTATIVADIMVGEKTFHIFVTHLGNGGPIVQQEALLQVVQGVPDVIAMGDFNFRPDTQQYQITRQVLDDAWLLKWPTGVDDQGVNPLRRIDHVFVSPGMQITGVWYLAGPASDHPAMKVEIIF